MFSNKEVERRKTAKLTLGAKGLFDIVFLQDEFSHLVQEWNAQRINALSRAFSQMLYPLLEKELKLKLLQEAKNFVVKVRLQVICTDIKQVKLNLTTPIPIV